MTRTSVGVLVSGAGSNLRALCEASRGADFPAEIGLVLCNRADAGAIGIAAEFGVATDVLPLRNYAGDTLARDHVMRDRFIAAGIELIVCAGYNRVLSDDFLNAFPNAIINVHPSLLPAFGGGMHAVEDAIRAGVRITGCTVHFLEPGATDAGPIILQAPVALEAGDTPETLRNRIHEQEWRLLPEAVALWCQGRLRRDGNRVQILEPHEVTTA